MIIAAAAFAVAIFMGINIGGNNAAASMGAAYGARARTKQQAVILIAVFSLLGAVLSGGEVIKTLGHGIVPGEFITVNAAIIAIAAAGISMFLANMARVPVSTSQAAVGAVAGVGVYVGMEYLRTDVLIRIAAWWVVTPLVAFILAYLMGKYLHPVILLWLVDHESEESIRRIINILLTISGCYVAYSAGANNAASAVGPLVGAGVMQPLTGAVVGGLAIGAGAVILGSRVLETVGDGITELCVVRAVFVEFVAAAIVHTASIMGIPVSLGEIVTASVIGIGCANQGLIATRNNTVRRIVSMWFVSPILAGTLTYLALTVIG